jgi:hypothetical protein
LIGDLLLTEDFTLPTMYNRLAVRESPRSTKSVLII